MIGLLDGDIVVFRCGFAAERNVWNLAWKPYVPTDPSGAYKDESAREFQEHKVFEYKREAEEFLDKVCPGKFSRVEGQDYSLWPERELQPLSHALHGVKKLINHVCDSCQINPETELIVMLSPGGQTFRHSIATTRPYKGNRKVEHRPTYEKEIRKYIRENWITQIAENEEADDLLGIAQTKYGPMDSIIMSLDKDLDQVPGLKYNWVNDVGYQVTEQQADINFCMQLLTGDSTDNIPGLPKIGPAKAAKILHGLQDYEAMMEEVARQYQIHSGVEDWFEYMREQGQLLWIRREPGQMWEPPAELDKGFEYTEEELTL